MSRTELGALVSRALAVWILCDLLSSVSDVFALAKANIREPAMGFIVVGTVLVKFGVVALLWFKAQSFGTWIGSESDNQEASSNLSKPDVASALVQGVAAYWVVWCLVQLGTSRAFNALSTTRYTEVFEQNRAFYLGTLGLGALALVSLFKAKDIARIL